MKSSLPLHDGGAFYHPEQPLGFHPSLRAAAQLLVAADRRRCGLRASVQRTVAAAPPIRLSLLSAPTVHFDLEHGFQIIRGVHTPAGHHRLDLQLEPANRLLAWAHDHHLASPWILELLLLTVQAWQELGARTRRVEMSLDRLTHLGSAESTVLQRRLADQRDQLQRACGDWGPWVEAMTRPLEEVDVTLLLELSRVHHLPYLRRRSRRRHPCSCLDLDIAGWRVELESWEEASARIHQELQAALELHEAHVREAADRAGLRPTPTKTASHHFEWLALRQVRGWSPRRIADRSGAGVSTVRTALREVSQLLELPLRFIPPGPAGL